MNAFFDSLLSSIVAASAGQPPMVQGFLFGMFVFFCSLVLLAVFVAFRSVAGSSRS
jgi:threonine/homoserine/homoserine lactone efflux protein